MAKRVVNFRAPDPLVVRIDREAEAVGRTRSEYICRILEGLDGKKERMLEQVIGSKKGKRQ
jgi:hypothetical protein